MQKEYCTNLFLVAQSNHQIAEEMERKNELFIIPRFTEVEGK